VVLVVMSVELALSELPLALALAIGCWGADRVAVALLPAAIGTSATSADSFVGVLWSCRWLA
jgi:hypothetical protein